MKVKGIFFIIITFVILTSIQLPVFAVESFNTQLVTSSAEIKKGEELEVIFSFKDFQDINKGINSYKATLEYDSNLFEEVKASDFKSLNSWEEFLYNPENQEFIAIKKAGVKSDEEVLTLSLKAKENVVPSETIVKIKDIVASEGKKDISLDNSQVTIQVIKEQDAQKPNNTENQENNNQNNENNELATGELPYTGLNPLISFIFVAIEILVVIAIILYVKIKKIDKKISKKGKIIFTILVAGIITTQLVGTIYAVAQKGELNDDGTIDYKDVSLLEQHLINLNSLPEDKQTNADINSDGKLTVTDLTLLVQKIENTLDYEIDVTSNMDNYYPQKSEEIELKFSANVSYDAKIESVTINGQEYQVENEAGTINYVAKIKVQENSGIQEFKFTKAKLNVGKEIDIDYVEKVDVLKEKPTIQNYKVTEIVENAKLKVAFDVKDNDNSLLDAKIQLFEENVETKLVKEEKVNSGNNEFTLDLEENKDYILNIYLSYNLDSDQLTEHEQDNTGSILETKELKLNIDYKFEFSNIKLYNEEGQEVDKYSKNEPIIVGFTSTNATKFLPKYVVINGQKYEVTSSENSTYKVKINGIDKTGEYELKVEEIILENGKSFTIESSNTVNVKIQKEKPEVRNVNIEEQEGRIKVAFDIKDTDNSLVNKKIVIKNANGDNIFEKEIQGNSFDEICKIPNDLTTKYTIEVIADYDITTDGSNEQKNQIIYKKEIEAKQRVIIGNVTLSKTSLEKNENLTINYEITTNKIGNIEKLVVNNIEAKATKGENDTYSVTIPAGNIAGQQEIKLAKVIFDDETQISTNNIQEIEVLKSVPLVENYQAEDDYDNTKVEFDFELKDEDNSFISGYVQLVTLDGKLKEKQEITSSGTQHFSIEVQEKEEYNFQVVVTYARNEDKTEIITDKVLLEKPIQMIINYELEVSNIQTKNNTTNEDTKYFNRNENIKLVFTSTNLTKFFPEKAQINGKEYVVTSLGSNQYEATLDTIENVGLAEIKIEKIWMNNTKELEVKENNVAEIEILKLAPTVNNFEYEETQDSKVIAKFEIVDNESAMTNAKVVVTDVTGKIYEKNDLKKGQNEITFDLTSSEEYTVKIFADYDLDGNYLEIGANEHQNIEIDKEEIQILAELIELKDITSVKLYSKTDDDAVEEIRQLNVKDFDESKYIAKIDMEELPVFYAEIEQGVVEEGEFKLVLKYDNVVQYDETAKLNKLKVKFGEVDNDIVNNLKFEDIIEIIQNDEAANINLTNDLDASNITVSTSTYFQNFKGTFNGNGHTIKNLSKPLFDKLENAKVSSLIIENAKVSGNSGILANYATEAQIDNVHIKDSTIQTWHSNGTGGFIGKAENATVIENCSANNLKVSGVKIVGGLAGYLNSNSEINNCYIQGAIVSSYDAIGGIVGQSSGAIKIQNTYSNVEMQNSVSHANAGIIGYAGGNNVTLINNISLADGNHSSKNNYEIEESKLASNSDNDRVKVISKEDINEEFFKETLGWDDEIWRLENVSANKLPALKNSDPIDKLNQMVTPENKDLYIPDIARLKKMSNYDTNKEIAYHNMNLLIPFYDARLCVEYGNIIDINDQLNQEKIQMIIPYDSNNKMIVGINTNNYDKIAKIRLVFEDEQTKDYTVEFKKKLENIATYTIKDLGVGYNYNKFILDTNIETVGEIVSQAKELDYKAEIQTVTPEDESRLYVDYYNQSVKNNLDQVMLAIMSNQGDYNLYLDNEILKQKIKQDMTENSELEKLLYTYNYFDKWYHIEMGEIPLSQIIFLNPDMLNKDIEIKDLVDTTISQEENIRKTANTVGYYNNVIKSKFGNKEIGEFLEYFMKILEDYDNGNDWFTDNFEGMMTERPIIGKEDTVRYRAWEMLKIRNHLLLPILTAPQEDMYIISVPSQFIFGSLNRYENHVYGKDEEMREDLDQYADYIQNFYEVSSSFIKNSEELLNKHVHIQYDTRGGFPNSGTQEAGKTEDGVIKWVYEAVGVMPPISGSGAYANGTDAFWVVNAALVRGTYSFIVFSHETAHNQDGYYFYEENYRRNNTWAEDHADENIAQDLGDGSLVFNIREDLPITSDNSSNLKLERITGADNIYTYYKEMFETYYVLDYLTGQAFLQLTPEEQARVAVKVTYDNSNDYEVGGSKTRYIQLTAEDFKNMNLRTMEDLWDNSIALRGTGSVGDGGEYYGDTHYSIYWYQPHNNNGRPDSYSFKRLGFEMLGVGGYSDGYVTYRSTKSTTDLDALRQITKNDTITWKQYKMNRYKTVEQNLNNIPYFNSQEVIEAYKQALQKDAKNGNRNNTNALRRTLYGTVKRATQDFSTGSIYNSGTEIEISSAEQLVNVLKTAEWGNYKLVNDIDFSNITTTENAYITNVFVGRLNGNNHKIKGLQKALFNQITYAQIQNVIIEAPNYISESTAIIANTSKNSVLKDVVVSDSNISIPFVKTTNGLLQLLGNNEINIHNNEITTVEDLLKISDLENPLNKKKVYELKADLDLSPVTGVDAIITGTFEGTINGNGHTISNLKVPLITTLTGSVSNLNIENVEIKKSGTNNLAPLAGETRGATISDIKVNNVTIEGRDNISAVVGIARSNTRFDRISATNITIKASNYYAGGIIGRSYDSKLKDIVVSGTLEVIHTHNGGVIGALNRDSLENIYADVDVIRIRNGDSRNKNAGLYGAIEANPVSIKNAIVVGDMSETLYKVTPATTEGEINSIETYFTNVYEYEDSTGISNSEVTNVIKKATSENLKDINFYIETMGWSSDIWDFSNITYGESPNIK